MFTIVFGGMHVHSNLLGKQERSGVLGLHTGDTGIAKLLQTKCFCRSTYKHKATTVNVLRPTTVEKQNCIKTLHSGRIGLHKTTGLSKIGGGQYDTQCIPYLSIKCCPHTVIAPSSV